MPACRGCGAGLRLRTGLSGKCQDLLKPRLDNQSHTQTWSPDMKPTSGIGVLVVATILANAGCRHTTSPATGGSPLIPIGPLTPSGSTVPPNLNPLGSNPFSGGGTRVSPPPTGPVGAPNNYMGGVAPTGYLGANTQWNGNVTAPPSGPGNVAYGGAIGSGIAQTGYQPDAIPNQPTSSFQGALKLNDLTNAPPPPGYRGSNGQPGFAPAGGYQAPLNPINTNPNALVPITPVNPTNGFGPVPSPSPATSERVWQSAQAGGTLPSTSPAPATGNGQGSNLNWQTPGTF